MVTPTVIRFQKKDNVIGQVVTYRDKQKICSVFQTYIVNSGGYTMLQDSIPYSGEGAIVAFDTWHNSSSTAI